jgi:hypothetical protein
LWDEDTPSTGGTPESSQPRHFKGALFEKADDLMKAAGDGRAISDSGLVWLWNK